jgi:hypothetical protein
MLRAARLPERLRPFALEAWPIIDLTRRVRASCKSGKVSTLVTGTIADGARPLMNVSAKRVSVARSPAMSTAAHLAASISRSLHGCPLILLRSAPAIYRFAHWQSMRGGQPRPQTPECVRLTSARRPSVHSGETRRRRARRQKVASTPENRRRLLAARMFQGDILPPS